MTVRSKCRYVNAFLIIGKSGSVTARRSVSTESFCHCYTVEIISEGSGTAGLRSGQVCVLHFGAP